MVATSLQAAFVLHHRGAGDHRQPRDLRQLGNQLLHHAIGKVGLIRLRAEVDKGQHRYPRLLQRSHRLMVCPPPQPERAQQHQGHHQRALPHADQPPSDGAALVVWHVAPRVRIATGRSGARPCCIRLPPFTSPGGPAARRGLPAPVPTQPPRQCQQVRRRMSDSGDMESVSACGTSSSTSVRRTLLDAGHKAIPIAAQRLNDALRSATITERLADRTDDPLHGCLTDKPP